MILFYQIAYAITILFLFLYFIKGFFELSGLVKSIKFLNSPKYIFDRSENELPFIYILLPVLREQKVIQSTIDNFLEINYPISRYKVVLITTEKEIVEKKNNIINLKLAATCLAKRCTEEKFVSEYLGLFPEHKLREIHRKLNSGKYEEIFIELKKEYINFPTTIKLLESIINKRKDKRIIVLHYPCTNGVMAHQINYACEQILKDESSLDSYICIYNADSKVDKDIFWEVCDVIEKNKGKEFVIQQSAIFLKNVKSIKNGIGKFFVYAGGLFQSHWTFAIEMPRILRQNISVREKHVRLAHCVGHGLYIRLGLFKDLGLLPVETLNEDLAFGFKLSANRIPIYPLKKLEIADTPETFKSLINQKKVWFYSYLEYYKARRISLRNSNEKTLVDNLFVQGSLYGLIWLINSWLLLIPILFSIMYKEYIFFYIVILFLIVFNFVPYIILLNEIDKKTICKNFNMNFSFREKIILSFFSVLIYFTDSFGPILSVKEILMSKMLGKNIYKNKTER